MKKILILSVLMALIAFASAHSLYAEFPEKLECGSEAEVWIAYGHGGTTEPNHIDLTAAMLVSPDGKTVDLELEPHKSGLLGAISPEEKGCYILDLQAESALFDPSWYGSSGSKSLVEKYAHVLMPVESGEGFGWFDGRGLEILPDVNPYGLKSGDDFAAHALWNGKPVAGSYSAIVVRSPEEVLVIQHAQNADIEGDSPDGQLNFQLTRPGLWVLSYDASIDESGRWIATTDDSKGHWESGDELAYDQITPTAYLTFWVEK